MGGWLGAVEIDSRFRIHFKTFGSSDEKRFYATQMDDRSGGGATARARSFFKVLRGNAWEMQLINYENGAVVARLALK